MASGRQFNQSSFVGRRDAGAGMYGSMDRNQRQLNSIASWNTLSSVMTNAYNIGTRVIKQYQELEKNASAFQMQAKQRKLGGFAESLSSVGKGIGGTEGAQIRSIIAKYIGEIQSKGGANIANDELARTIGDLINQLRPIATAMSGSQGEMMRNVISSLGSAKEGAAKGGVESLTKSTKSIQGSADKIRDLRYLDNVIKNVATGIQNVANTLADNGVKSALTLLKDNFLVAAISAKTLSEKQKILADLSDKTSSIAATATGTDKTVVEKLAEKTAEKKEEVDKGIRGRNIHRLILRGQQIALKSIKGIADVGKQLPVLKKSFDVVAQGFNIVNSKANAFARTQMAIASERGAYGRQLRGAGINTGKMMAALASGRLAGMEDRTVINQMVGLQEQLALARWGEGGLIDKAGRWGISVYDAQGHTKSNDQMMIEYSRKLNSITDQAEKLQFLSHIGFRPEQMEYVQNYEREAKRIEEIRRNPSLRGVLEDARILDESGYYAKADAATKIELKRRQILNQNAIDEGLLPAIMRGINPENWFFSDWTARQQGVKSARSEIAIKKLNEELEKVRGELSKNSGALSSNTSNLISLDAKTLAGLSLSGGWATADLANKGSKSAVHALRASYAKQLGTENLDQVDSRKKTATWLGGLGVGGTILAGGLLAGVTGGLGLLALLAAAGAAGGLTSFGIFNMDFDDGTQKHVDRLRELAREKKWNEIDKYATKYGLQGITPEMILSDDFMKDDEKAKHSIRGAHVGGHLINAQALSERNLDLQAAMDFTSDKYYKANLKAAREKGLSSTTDKQMEEAMARRGSGNQTIGTDDETLGNYILYGFDTNDPETRMKIAQRVGKLRSKKENRGKSFEELNKMATEDMKAEWASGISEEQLQAATRYLGQRQADIDEKEVRKELQQLGFGEGRINDILKMSDQALNAEISAREQTPEGFETESMLYNRLNTVRVLKSLRKGDRERLASKERNEGIKQVEDIRRLKEKKKQEQEDKSKKDKGTGGVNNPPPPPDTTKSSLQKEREQTSEEKSLDERMRAEGASMEGALAANMKKAPLAQRSDIRKMREMVGSGATREELIRHFGRDRYEQFAKVHPDEAEKARKNSGLGVDRAAADQETFRKEDASAYAKAAIEEKEALKSTDAWNRRQGLGVITSSGSGLGGSGTLLGGGQTLLGGGQTLLGGGQIRLEGLGRARIRPTVVGEGNWGRDPYAKIKPKKTEVIDNDQGLEDQKAVWDKTMGPGYKEGMSKKEYQDALIRTWKENGKYDKFSDEGTLFAKLIEAGKLYDDRQKFDEYYNKRNKGKKKAKGKEVKTGSGVAEKKPGFPLEGMPADIEKDAVKELTEKEKQTEQATSTMAAKAGAAEAAAASGNVKASGGDTISKVNNITVNNNNTQNFENSDGDRVGAEEGAKAGLEEGTKAMIAALVTTSESVGHG